MRASFRLLIGGKIALAPKLVTCSHMLGGSNAHDQINYVLYIPFILKEVQANVAWLCTCQPGDQD